MVLQTNQFHEIADEGFSIVSEIWSFFPFFFITRNCVIVTRELCIKSFDPIVGNAVAIDGKGRIGLFLLIFSIYISTDANTYGRRAMHALHFLAGKLRFENPFSIFVRGLFLTGVGHTRVHVCTHVLRRFMHIKGASTYRTNLYFGLTMCITSRYE